MILLENDEENSPWMVLGDLQFWSATGFAHSLRNHAREQGLPWYVAAMLPIEFIWPGMEVRRKLAPDTFVSFVHDHSRTAYDLARGRGARARGGGAATRGGGTPSRRAGERALAARSGPAPGRTGQQPGVTA